MSIQMYQEMLALARVELSLLYVTSHDPMRELHLEQHIAELEGILSSPVQVEKYETCDQGDHTLLPTDWEPDETYF